MRKITLEAPIKRGDGDVKEVALRRPTAGEMRGLQLTMVMGLDVATIQKLLPRITEPALTPAEIDAMDIGDFSSLSMEVLGFFGASMREAVGAMGG